MLTQHQFDSEAGKAPASFALFLLPDEDPAGFASLHDRLRAEYFPATTSQKILVEDIARSWWKVLRADALQATAAPADVRTLNHCERYAASARRAYHKAIHSLIRLQKIQRVQTESFQREALKSLVGLGKRSDDKRDPVSA